MVGTRQTGSSGGLAASSIALVITVSLSCNSKRRMATNIGYTHHRLSELQLQEENGYKQWLQTFADLAQSRHEGVQAVASYDLTHEKLNSIPGCTPERYWALPPVCNYPGAEAGGSYDHRTSIRCSTFQSEEVVILMDSMASVLNTDASLPLSEESTSFDQSTNIQWNNMKNTVFCTFGCNVFLNFPRSTNLSNKTEFGLMLGSLWYKIETLVGVGVSRRIGTIGIVGTLPYQGRNGERSDWGLLVCRLHFDLVVMFVINYCPTAHWGEEHSRYHADPKYLTWKAWNRIYRSLKNTCFRQLSGANMFEQVDSSRYTRKDLEHRLRQNAYTGMLASETDLRKNTSSTGGVIVKRFDVTYWRSRSVVQPMPIRRRPVSGCVEGAPDELFGKSYPISEQIEHAFASKAWLYVPHSRFPVIETVAAGTNVPMRPMVPNSAFKVHSPNNFYEYSAVEQSDQSQKPATYRARNSVQKQRTADKTCPNFVIFAKHNHNGAKLFSWWGFEKNLQELSLKVHIEPSNTEMKYNRCSGNDNPSALGSNRSIKDVMCAKEHGD
ncbi:hypothetical protein CLF_110700 [Clonorchis sinensis]|uniref:Uncharacterized protein n=1 Tax=Clonorchis sinensis TaxID=79923 RepID=G7YTS6_CLOSI|nr:hypothetical protein CLF_110700 [Clonorchis sinensis]